MKNLTTNDTKIIAGGAGESQEYKEEAKDFAKRTKDEIAENAKKAKDKFGEGLESLSDKIDDLGHKIKK